ncbi:MAG: RecX family transcriptional regulator [Patescibacteria group bacterium]
MKITKIQSAVKTAGRYNIFVDGEYSFSLDENQLLDQKLVVGLEIQDAQLGQLKDESEFGKAYTRALELIMRRPRSEKEMRDYARRKKWSDEIYQKVLARLKDKSYVDDKKFAEFWLKARIGGKPTSKRKISAELAQKGISREIADSVTSSYSNEDELDTLKILVNKKQSKYPDEKKFMAYLASQGYRFDQIKQVLSEED